LALNSSHRPVVASYCATFLKPEMLHIYRQITGLERVRPVVIAQKRELESQFPFSPVYVVRKPPTHFLRRFWHRQLRDEPWRISKGELDALLRVLDRFNVQLLHIYFGHIGVHLLPLIQAWPRATVVSFHGADVMVDLDKPAYRRATIEMLGAVRRVLVRSESLAKAIRELGCDAGKIDVVRTGIPLAEFEYRSRCFPETGQWRLLQAGRLIEKKGYPTTLRAFAQFAKLHPQARLTIAGEGPMLEELKTLVIELKIEKQVDFTGLIEPEKLRRLFYASHVFLHPSQTGRDGNQEGVPNSMLEAMATGLPVFATTHGGIAEAVETGVSGILVNEGDAAGLNRALVTATEDPDLLDRLGRAAANVVRQKFDQRIQVHTLEDVYLSTIGG
jgi:colanic acid/amylovoran biosynthesis glycosyltransferase